ncbi:Zn-ribbon domain-containing OB-fold protein [Methanobrevibacter arboriphilus]|uniref:Zn-ribbon domain-containing OB-fold protein n=1 Tax=Methanobrevibacter arboriphilus TaxID=39441 RepID=UPI0006D1628E|nr:Zn-ribbon domain-containing OB-fold protein [Methanobrevibacter arboriphilus]
MSDIVRTWRHIQQRYNLIGSKCTNCDGVYFPPRVICPKCRRKGKIENIQFSGKGKIHSFSIVETPTDDFKTIAPYAVAIIDLEEGARLTSQLVDCDLNEIEIGGDPVEMVFRKIREDGEDGVISYGFKFKPIK